MNEHDQPSQLSQFVAEMRRRRVVRFSLGYAMVAFVALQLAEIVFPAFGIGENGLRILVITITLGFPPSAVLSWLFDFTRQGITRTEGGDGSVLPRFVLLVVTVGLTSGLGLWLAQSGAFSAEATAQHAGMELASDDHPEIRSLAVLPLDDYSPEGGHEYFTAGMHEELIAWLSFLDGLRVVSRTSVARFADTTMSAPEIGRELGVDALIEGSVTFSGDRVRITLQLIHAASDSHIRTFRYERDVGDVLALQSEVAHDVAHEIEGELTPAEEELFGQTAMSVDPAAQEAYLIGKQEYDRGTADGYRMALEYFEDAVEADPDFAPAMAGLAGARFLVGLEENAPDPGGLEQAHAEAHDALEMDSASVEAREVLAYIERSIPRVSETRPVSPPTPGTRGVRVLTMPGSSDSIVVDMSTLDTMWVAAMTSLGRRLEESVRRRSMAGDAMGASPEWFAARQLIGSGDFSAASAVLEGVVAAAPDFAPGWEMLTRAEVSAGDAAGVADIVRRWHDADAAGAPNEEWVIRLEHGVESNSLRDYWEWTLDRIVTAQSEGRPFRMTELAAANAALGEDEAALTYLVQAFEQGEPGLLTLQTDPVWDDLRGYPQFKELTRQARRIRFAPVPRGGRGGRGGG